jgi:hypothetical protein
LHFGKKLHLKNKLILFLFLILKASFIRHNGQKKNLVNKNQVWELLHQKYKANENTSKYNPKKKQKQTINKN